MDSKNNNAIITICVGPECEKIAELTHPTIKKYAESINADFIKNTESFCSTPHWDKFALIYRYLNKYKRILYLDTDLIIREKTPNLFDIVPEYKIGAFNEAPFTDGRAHALTKASEDYGMRLKNWNGKYYNTGVLLISRPHKYLFVKPEKEISYFYEQSYLNLIFSNENVSMHDLPYTLNRMTCMDKFTGEERHASYIIHYAGYHYINNSLNFLLDLIPRDVEKWEKDSPNYNYKRHILVDVQGGLGDQIDAEPAIRYMKKYVYPNDEIIIKTHFPRIFEHLDIPTYEHDDFKSQMDTPYFHIITLPGPETLTWSIVSNLLCHTVDYTSMAILRRTLPNKDKIIKLAIKPEDILKVLEVVGIRDLNNLVLLHCGKHWQSKAQPLYSKIKTPNGWIQMKNIKIGDVVCIPNGKVARVTEIFPQGMQPTYRLTFEDGRFTDCAEDHLWKVLSWSWKYKFKNCHKECYKVEDPWRILSLKEIMKHKNKRGLFIPFTSNVYGEKQDLSLDPYVLGVLLGDGHFGHSITFTNVDSEIIQNVKNKLIEGYILTQAGKIAYRITTKIQPCKQNKYHQNLEELNLIGKLAWEKFVPEIYKEASIEQRLQILQGLMDTDGSVGGTKAAQQKYKRTGGTISYPTTSYQLALDVQYLVRSLGGSCWLSKHQGKRTYKDSKGNKCRKLGRIYYKCHIRHSTPQIFFKLSRKATAAKKEKDIILNNKIKSIEYIGEQEVQCIAIDHSDHLYLTDDFIVTHNCFPVEWWQAIVDGLYKEVPLCLIGADNEPTRGTAKVKVPEGVIDTRDLLDLGGFFAIVSAAKLLITNDSSPIHVAGAFNKDIILIPSCKHEDHLLPWREDPDTGIISQYYKAKALYKRLTLEDCESAPTCTAGSSAEFIKRPWDEYLPSPSEVIDEAIKRYNAK
jgi:hypothetical protein